MKRKKDQEIIEYHQLEAGSGPKQQGAGRFKNAAVISVCIVCFLLGYLVHNMLDTGTVTSDPDFDKLEQIYQTMSNDWYFGKEDKDLHHTLLTNAINGMLENAYDPHTMYMEPEEYESFASSLQGNFVGIGIQYYELNEDTFLVERVFKGSGAEAGGMLKGDVIVAVDGTEVKGKTLDEISAMIKGEEGSDVVITVMRENAKKDLTITRSVVNDSVYGYEKGDIGVLEINTFAETSGDEVGKYLAEFKQQGKRRLIIDLRGNGGGYVTAAMQIASYLIPEGAVVYKEEAKDGTISEQLAYDDYERYTFDHIVILINGETASASEVLTSCLKAQLDHVTTVGVKSYGKGTVQIPVTFEDGSSFKYTIAEWLTPAEEHINNVGITPDYVVELDKAITTGIMEMEEGASYAADSVSVYAKPVQIYLKFLGYDADRVDEYFSPTSAAALKRYQSEHDLKADGVINAETIQSLLSSCAKKWHDEQNQLDLQLNRAVEILK